MKEVRFGALALQCGTSFVRKGRVLRNINAQKGQKIE